jgi:hypothetical protein
MRRNLPRFTPPKAARPDNRARCAAAVTAMLAMALLAACTPMRWERDGQALDYADTDWNTCRSQSIFRANRWSFDPFPRTFIGRDARGRPFTAFRQSPFPDRFMLEREYLDNCLRARGFRLVPKAPDNAAAPAPAATKPVGKEEP